MDNGDEDRPIDRSRHVKESIREAAGALFAELGFGATGIREIAARAGVDPALVIRHFGSKEGLFLRTMRVGGAFSAVMTGPLDGMGKRMVRFLLSDEADGGLRGVFVALLRASDRPEIQQQFRAGLQSGIVEPLLDRLPAADGELRARLFAAQMSGLMSALWVSDDPFFKIIDSEDIVDLYAPALQELLTPTRM